MLANMSTLVAFCALYNSHSDRFFRVVLIDNILIL